MNKKFTFFVRMLILVMALGFGAIVAPNAAMAVPGEGDVGTENALPPIAPTSGSTGDIEIPVLYGDIVVDGDTEHNQLHQVDPGDSVIYTGKVNVNPIKQQMEKIQELQNVPGGALPDITLSDTKSEFKATFELAGDLEFTNSPTMGNVVLKGADSAFKVSDVQVAGKTTTVTMSLKEAFNTYNKLKAAVMSCAEWLEISLPAVKIPATANPGTKYTVKGALTGNMSATAMLGPISKAFDFDWDVVQNDEGRDFDLGTPAADSAEAKAIQFTSVVNQPKPDGGTTTDERFIIDASAENGTINPEGKTSVLAGADFAVNYQPLEGYSLLKLLVDEVEMDINTFANSYLFGNVRANHVIKAIFAKSEDPKDPGKDTPGDKDPKDPVKPNTPTDNNNDKPNTVVPAKPSVVTPATPVKTGQIQSAQPVQTGDTAPFTGYALLMGLAFGAMVLLRRRCR